MLRDDAPKTKASKPDLTKLIRSTEDALTGIAWNDDASVVHQVARKLYCDNKNPNPGCLIEIEECEE
jgi:Holliday junction resolvase RusA-like endonuclease